MPVDSFENRTMTIQSGQGHYDVVFCESLERVGALASSTDTFVAVDEHVLSLYPGITALFASEHLYAFPALEEEKTLAGVERLCRFLQRKGASKRSELVVIGGGIAQDIGTFAGHIYYRGIPFVYVPTTLLSMADSCIGAKCGVNLGDFKNQLGFFQSPRRVIVWQGFLRTLAPNDVRSGFGEIVKLAITSGDEDFSWLERRFDEMDTAIDGVEAAVFRSLETKRRVIEEDEYEANIRKTLNYGHTFGHALEALTQHEVPHGLAVAWGVDVANFIAMRTGVLAPEVFDRIHALLKRHFALKVHAEYDGIALVDAMRRDKKAAGDTVTLVLPAAIGRLQLVPTTLDSTLASHVDQYIKQHNVFTR